MPYLFWTTIFLGAVGCALAVPNFFFRNYNEPFGGFRLWEPYPSPGGLLRKIGAHRFW
jgi:hypothetical protein